MVSTALARNWVLVKSPATVASVAAPVGRLTVPLIFVTFQVPLWVAANDVLAILPIVLEPVGNAALTATLTLLALNCASVRPTLTASVPPNLVSMALNVLLPVVCNALVEAPVGNGNATTLRTST